MKKRLRISKKCFILCASPDVDAKGRRVEKLHARAPSLLVLMDAQVVNV